MLTTNDPIADMLTRIRNANTAKHDTVEIPASKMKLAIAGILQDEGYIRKYELVDAGKGDFKHIKIELKYNDNKKEMRIYAGRDELPRVLGGLGVAIISTNKGVVTDKKARELGVGGEVLAFIW